MVGWTSASFLLTNLYSVQRWHGGHQECRLRWGSFDAKWLLPSVINCAALPAVGNHFKLCNTGCRASSVSSCFSSLPHMSTFSSLSCEFEVIIHFPDLVHVHYVCIPASTVGECFYSLVPHFLVLQGFRWHMGTSLVALDALVQALWLSSHKAE